MGGAFSVGVVDGVTIKFDPTMIDVITVTREIDIRIAL